MKDLFKEAAKAKVKLLKAIEKYFGVAGKLPVYFVEWKYQNETEYTKAYFFKEEDAQKAKARFESDPERQAKEVDFILILSPSWYI